MELIKNRITILLFFIALVSGILSIQIIYPASAQTDSATWTNPVNLSQSGGNTDPHLVVDTEGRVHVYWFNDFDELTYTYRNQMGIWSDPLPTQAPFEYDLSALQLMPDPGGFIHALWLEGGSYLYYSRTTSITTSLAWNLAEYLGEGVIGFHASLAGDSTVHLVYATYGRNPTGIYYRSLDDAGTWSTPTLIHQSPYLRNLAPGGANLSIDAGRNGDISITWDDPYLERVYTAWSQDSGETWSDPGIIDQRGENDSLDSIGPSKPMIQINDEGTLVLWQAGHEGEICTQYFTLLPKDLSASTMTSSLEGENGQVLDVTRQAFTSFSQECPAELNLLETRDGTLWLLSKSNDRLQLSVWSGSEWSPSQSQNDINNFINPNTYRRLDLDKDQVVFTQDGLLYVGCDSGSTRDIWFSERSLGITASWFPTPTPPPLWSSPTTVTEGDELISSPILLSSPTNRIHALWATVEGRIFYAHFEEDRWTQPVSILISPGEKVGELSAVIDPNGYIFIAWDVPGSKEIFYSWVQESVANVANMWFSSQSLPITNTIRSPQVRIDPEGRVEIAFVIPVNEGRGIYLLQSLEPIREDESLQWQPPQTIFNAEEAGWSMVDELRLTESVDGTKIILLNRFDPPPGGEAIGLYTSHFTNDIWTVPRELAQDTITWSQVLSSPEGTVHVAWQIKGEGNQSTLWHIFSTDQGQSWSDPTRVLGFSSGEGPASLAFDQAGRLHLVQVTQSGFITLDGTRSLTLQNWVLNGSEWESGEQLPLRNVINPRALSADITRDNNLAVIILAEIIPDNEADETMNALVFSQQSIDLPQSLITPLPTFTPVPTQFQEEPTPQPTPTPMLEFSTESGTRLPAFLNNRWAGLLVGGIPAVLIVSLALTAILRRSRR